MKIETITARNLELILPLIEKYQVFYGVIPDIARNFTFFAELARTPKEGIQFIIFAQDNFRAPVGFATLYFLRSSITAQSYCLLNDLYTESMVRGHGYGKALILHCATFARERGYAGMEWQTAVSNERAQRLYDSLPTQRSEWFTYQLSTGKSRGAQL